MLTIILSEPNKMNIFKIFDIIYKLDNEDYLYLIMPVFTKLINNTFNPPSFKEKPSLETIKCVFHYFSKTL